MLLFGKDKRHLLKFTQSLGSQVTVGVGDKFEPLDHPSVTENCECERIRREGGRSNCQEYSYTVA